MPVARYYDMTDRMLLVGDNLDVLPGIPDDYVDFVYSDPPFNSNRNYSIIWKFDSGDAPPPLTESFTDTWTWNQHTVELYRQVENRLALEDDQVALAMLRGFKEGLSRPDNSASPLLAYLTHMTARFLEIRRVLKPTGQVCTHVDPTAGHYIKVLKDAIFGPDNFLNEIIWHYKTSSGSPKYWLHRNHDIILRYVNGSLEGMTWNHPKEPWPESTLKKWQKDEEGRIYRVQNKFGKRYYIDPEGKKADDVWQITLASRDSERVGYQTQKPLELMRKLISSMTNKGDVVLDPFMGGGTTLLAAEELKRQWIGIDLTSVALNMTRRRFLKGFPELDLDADVQTNGWPGDMPSVYEFVDRAGEYNFQVWVCDMLGAAPNKSKGADGGIDGRIYFREHPDVSDLRLGIVGVTKSKLSRSRVSDFVNVVNETGAAFGVYVSLEGWSKQAEEIAASASIEPYRTTWGEEYPKIQLMTVEQILVDGDRPRYPEWNNVTYDQVKGFKRPPKHTPANEVPRDQMSLGFNGV